MINERTDSDMTDLDALRHAIAQTQVLLDDNGIPPEARDLPTPCSEYDVEGLIDHLIGSHLFLVAAAGGDAEDPGGAPAERHALVCSAAVEAWEIRGDSGSVTLGTSDVPASFAISLHAFEAFVHAWDLATSLGMTFDPTDEQVATAWAAARVLIDDDNRSTESGAAFGPVVAVAEGATDMDRLIAFTGRAPIPV